MQLHPVGIGAAHLGDLLAPAHVLVFLHQQRLVVRVGREKGVVVLEDHQVAIATQAGAGIHHAAIGRGQYRITRLASNIETLVARLVKARQQGA